jgi:hypothetical protein
LRIGAPPGEVGHHRPVEECAFVRRVIRLDGRELRQCPQLQPASLERVCRAVGTLGQGQPQAETRLTVVRRELQRETVVRFGCRTMAQRQFDVGEPGQPPRLRMRPAIC